MIMMVRGDIDTEQGPGQEEGLVPGRGEGLVLALGTGKGMLTLVNGFKYLRRKVIFACSFVKNFKVLCATFS